MAFDFETLLSAALHDIKNQMQALLSVQEDLADELVGHERYQESLDKIQQHSQVDRKSGSAGMPRPIS